MSRWRTGAAVTAGGGGGAGGLAEQPSNELPNNKALTTRDRDGIAFLP
jgi:hypothetical protein